MYLDALFQSVNDVGHNGAGGGQLARALAVEHDVAEHIALHQNGVEHVIDARQLVRVGDEHRLDARGHLTVPALVVPGDQLDGAVELFGGLDVSNGDVTDAAGRDVVRVDVMPAGEAGQNGDLAAGIAAIYIVAGVLRLGIAELLGNFQGLVKAHVLALHLRQHEVRRAVDDAADAADMVGGQALVHRGDDRRAAADAGLKQEGRAVLFGKGQQLCAVGRDHLLVGGADAAPALEALAHIRVGKFCAANGLDDDLDFGVIQDRVDGFRKKRGIRRTGKVPHIQDIFDLDGLTGAAGDGGRIAAADLQHTGADRAEAHDCDFSHWKNPPILTLTRYMLCRGRVCPARGFPAIELFRQGCGRGMPRPYPAVTRLCGSPPRTAGGTGGSASRPPASASCRCGL